MERLRERDLRTLLEFLAESYVLRDLDEYSTHIVSALPKVVPSEITTYNEINPTRRRGTWIWNPASLLPPPDLRAAFERHIPEHALIAYTARTRDGSAHKISDFLTREQFHRLGLYDEFFRHLDVEYQMAVGLPSARPLVIGIALNRSLTDFSEHDRLVLNLLRPHLIQAHRNAETVTGMKRELTLLRQGTEALDGGMILLGRDGRVRRMTARARQWMVECFGVPPRQPNRLPEALQRWVRHEEARLAGSGGVPAPREPLLVESEGKRLQVRLLADGGDRLLLLEERRTALEPSSLEALGLTRREAEALGWLAGGKSNTEIAAILGLSPRTVAKHLERIYRKLGVESRTAAAACALEARAKGPGEGSCGTVRAR